MSVASVFGLIMVLSRYLTSFSTLMTSIFFFLLYSVYGILFLLILGVCNDATKAAMQKFTTKIVNMMKAERLYKSQGGPIIMSQVHSIFTSQHQFSLILLVINFTDPNMLAD